MKTVTNFFFFFDAAEALLVCEGNSTMLATAFLVRMSWQRLLNCFLGLFILQAHRQDVQKQDIFIKASHGIFI